MCLSHDGQLLKCDGKNCNAFTAVPVALRPRSPTSQVPRAAEGWLFIVRRGIAFHYCPNCAFGQLEKRVVESEKNASVT